MKTASIFSLEIYPCARVLSSRIKLKDGWLVKSRNLFAWVALAFLGISSSARAQVTSGDLVGIVVDPTGGAVSGAQVEVVEESTGIRATQTTEANGQYRFSNLH